LTRTSTALKLELALAAVMQVLRFPSSSLRDSTL
jgi:hypothetical protein